MNADKTQVLFVSASAADQLVLTALLAREETSTDIRVTAATTAQAFYDALYSERRFQVVVVDERLRWSDWPTVVASVSEHRRNALLVLMTNSNAAEIREADLGRSIAAVYARDSSGLIALASLVSKISAQARSFTLRRERSETSAEDQTVEAREGLVYAVSHDLQDPLQLARRYADVLNDDFVDELGESGGKVLGNLQFNLSRTQEMLDELLDFSRLESSVPEREPVDLDALLDETVGLYKVTLDEIGGIVTRQHALPTLMVDRRQFQRVFQNLIGNAIKFRSERPLHITVRAQRVRDEWRIGIKDNGVGLSEQDAARVFGMFERAGETANTAGTGMGLAICKRIVDNHGGKIWVRSSLGSGSVFIFSVPQTDDDAVLDDAAVL